MSQAYLTVICGIDPNNREAVQSYMSRVLPLLEAAGGRSVLRLKRIEMVKGNMAPLLSVIVFPNADAIRGVFQSAEYQQLIEARDKGFTDLSIAISDEFNPAAL